MRHAPEDAILAPYEMAAHMMQARRLPTRWFEPGRFGGRNGVERGAHLNMIEQRGTAVRVTCRAVPGMRSSAKTNGIRLWATLSSSRMV